MPSLSSPVPLKVGIVLFPDVTQLDVTGPYEVFARMPATQVYLVAATSAAVPSERGLAIVPHATFDTVPPLDVICVPGGVGVNVAMEDETLLRFLRDQARRARYVTSVCTGALVLGAAGLLRGYRATTHWMSLDLLTVFGANPVNERIVIDRNRITGAGVTAGIDFGLVVASELFGAAAAQEIELMIEYSPAPPFGTGSPNRAPANLLHRVIETRQDIQSNRRTVAERAAARLDRTAGPNQSTAHGLVRKLHASSHATRGRAKTGSAFDSATGYLEVVPTDTWPRASGATLDDFVLRAGAARGIAVAALEPGTTLLVKTRNSDYRFVVLFGPGALMVQGGSMFPEATVVQFDGATAGGSASKPGWILVGLQMEMRLGSMRIRSSRVRSASIVCVPAGYASRHHVRA